jgi:sulfur-carrier protein
MPSVVFTPHLKRHVDCPDRQVAGGTVRESLEEIFVDNETLRGYVVDERSHLRQHVVIFVDGQMIRDRLGLSDPVTETSEIYVMQALSGG